MAIITSYSTVCLRVCSGWQQSKHQCSALLALCEGFHKWMVWFVYPYSLGSYSLELGSHMTSPVPLKQPWRIWVNLACIETITKHDKIQTIYMHTSCEILYTQNRQIWWHHDMETLSTLLAICVGNPPFTEMWPWALISADDQVLIGCGLKETVYCLSPWPVTIELPCGGWAGYMHPVRDIEEISADWGNQRKKNVDNPSWLHLSWFHSSTSP